MPEGYWRSFDKLKMTELKGAKTKALPVTRQRFVNGC